MHQSPPPVAGELSPNAVLGAEGLLCMSSVDGGTIVTTVAAELGGLEGYETLNRFPC